GEVTVNRIPVTELPAWVDPEKDRIVVSGRPIRARRSGERLVYIMLFKPKGVICSNSAIEGKVRAIDLVNHPSRARLYPVGRLDVDSSGLLLLTNDGDLANRLTHPRYGVHKTYEVTVKGSLDAADVQRLQEGLVLYDRRVKAATRTQGVGLKLLKRDRERTMLLMELREGRNRQIRRMMLELGHPVKKLRRISMGPLKLRGVSMGQWRELTAQEVAMLRTAAERGEREAAKSGVKAS
ncbi:MAG: rRNA pseudouridine synthase, partial [Phycisphaerales bacterium]|nr:rRNA pseudouridine synthase [Phycisphaerales bacterium]